MEKITTLVFKFRFTPSPDSEEDFQRFPIFIQLEALTAILGDRQSLDTTLEEDDPMSIMRDDIGHGMAKDLVS